MIDEMTQRQLAPLDVYRHLAARKDLEVIRNELDVTCTVRTLRRLIIDTARAPSFLGAILADTPIELAPAIRRLLDGWFVGGVSEREHLRALRRAVVAIDQLRTSMQRGLGQ
jgi:hypothetical protein